MSRWVLALLLVYLIVGLRSSTKVAPTRVALWATGAVVFFAALKAGSL